MLQNNKNSILVIDDDGNVRSSITKYLSDYDFTVPEAKNGKAAEEKEKSNQGKSYRA